YVGVSSCVYALIHFSCHVLYQGDWDDLLQSFTKPFTWFGLTGLTMLVVLASTSNNWSVRKLGGKRWKLLHRLPYFSAVILIYHQSIACKGHWYVARWVLFLLLGLQTPPVIKSTLQGRARSSLAPPKTQEASR